ncbi:MAG: hypothetical protein P8Y70_19235 [Candidatus Lokiarchaeota archaeon]
MLKKEKFLEIKSILIACAVNTARSRIAEGFFNYFFSKNKLKIDIKSCGVGSNARDGMLISLDAILVMKEIGIELSTKSLSKSLKNHLELLNECDLIITMTGKQKKSVLKINQNNTIPVITLNEFAGKDGNIDDPSMKGIEGFRKIRDEIKECIVNGLRYYIPNLKS